MGERPACYLNRRTRQIGRYLPDPGSPPWLFGFTNTIDVSPHDTHPDGHHQHRRTISPTFVFEHAWGNSRRFFVIIVDAPLFRVAQRLDHYEGLTSRTPRLQGLPLPSDSLDE